MEPLTPEQIRALNPYPEPSRTLRESMSGDDVRWLQQALTLLGYNPGGNAINGAFGPNTARLVRQFQRDYGLNQTGVVDLRTRAVLKEAFARGGYSPNEGIDNPYPEPVRNLTLGDSGNDVRWLQFALIIAGYPVGPDGVDGIYGEDTRDAVMRLQRDLGMPVDGVAGVRVRAALYAAEGNAPGAEGVKEKIADLSKWQGDIDWELASQELLFAILRVQNGLTPDERFISYATSARQYGVPFGVYAFLQASTPEEAALEAAVFYERARRFQPNFYVVDVEYRTGDDMRAITSAFLDELQALGVEKTGIYVAHHYYDLFNLDLDQPGFVWLPRYGDNTGVYEGVDPDYPSDLHQYTSNGRLAGVNAPVDLNRLTGRTPLEWFITP